MESKKKFGLVLSAGGARAAYQVGVLKYIAEKYPEFRPTIFSGLSAGSINSTYLAQGDPFKESVSTLYQLWSQLNFNSIFRTNFQSMFSVSTKILNDLFLSKLTKKLLFHSVLDASPLALTLSNNMRFSKVWKALSEGRTDGVAVAATNYVTGKSDVFFDSHRPITPWKNEQRQAIRTSIRIRHIMASCAIPILFEPVRIGDKVYGDGSIRQTNPCSAAIRLGASHVLGISVNGPPQVQRDPALLRRPSLGFIFGVVLDSIFLDNLEPDFYMLKRLNRFGENTDEIRHIEGELIRPSIDPGNVAKDFLKEIPYHLRQLLKTAAVNPNDSGDLISYLLFSPKFLKAILELGEKDAANQRDRIEALL